MTLHMLKEVTNTVHSTQNKKSVFAYTTTGTDCQRGCSVRHSVVTGRSTHPLPLLFSVSQYYL